jgi:ribosomal-protein-alanine N-acetyltransferase
MLVMETPVLNTEKVILRKFRDSDILGFYQLTADSDVMQFIGGPKTLSQANNLLEEIIKGYNDGLSVRAVIYKPTMEFAGFAGLSIHGFQFPEMKIAIHKKYQRKGLARASLKFCSGYAEKVLGSNTLEICLKSDNKTAKKALRKLNFKFSKIVFLKGKSMEMYTHTISSHFDNSLNRI